MSNQSASRAFRSRVGLPPLDGSEVAPETEFSEAPLETDPEGSDGPVTDGDSGQNEPQPGADEDGFGGDAPEPQNTEPFPGDNV